MVGNKRWCFFTDALLYLPRIDLDGHKVYFDENKMHIKPLEVKFEVLWESVGKIWVENHENDPTRK